MEVKSKAAEETELVSRQRSTGGEAGRKGALKGRWGRHKNTDISNKSEQEDHGG